jgi:hypothetical protein
MYGNGRLNRESFRMTSTRTLLVAAIACALLSSCHAGGGPVAVANVTSGTPTDLQLRIAGRVRFEPDRIELGFLRVTEDSRCPRSVQCPWAGRAVIRLWLLPERADSVRVDVTEGAERDTLGYTIRLVRLDPYPETPGSIASSAYSARLRISRL